MPPNNVSRSDHSVRTTEVGSASQQLPGLSGRRVAWVVGVFTLFSAITIPVGLFIYQGISDREKQIQKDWPEVAAQFNVVYAAMDTHLTESGSDNSVPTGDPASGTRHHAAADLAQQWHSERRNFLFQRLWYQQVRAAQRLEDIFQKPVSADGESTIFFDKVSETLEPSEEDRLRAAHATAVAAYRRFETEQLAPYQKSLTTFPGQVVLFFFRLPEPPAFQPAELTTRR